MSILLTFLCVIIFFVGAYYMGNFLLDELDGDIVDRVMGTLYGCLCWFAIILLGVLFWGVYQFFSTGSFPPSPF
jgi:uncharacterized membrane protein required for colicin V production